MLLKKTFGSVQTIPFHQLFSFHISFENNLLFRQKFFGKYNRQRYWSPILWSVFLIYITKFREHYDFTFFPFLWTFLSSNHHIHILANKSAVLSLSYFKIG
jgi:hypothetical protein